MYKPASGADVITMREYAEGVLRRENVLRIGQVDHHKNEVKADRALRSEEKRASAKVSGHSLLLQNILLHFPGPSIEASYVKLATRYRGCRPVYAMQILRDSATLAKHSSHIVPDVRKRMLSRS